MNSAGQVESDEDPVDEYYEGEEGQADDPMGAAGQQQGYFDEHGNFYAAEVDEDGGGYIQYGENEIYAAGGDEGYGEGQWARQDGGGGMYSNGEMNCCKSFMTSVYPLMVAIIVLNSLLLIFGALILGTGCDILLGGKATVSNFAQIEGVVSSSPFLFACLCIAMGSLIIFFSCVGIAMAKFMAIGNPWGFLRLCYFAYQSFLILITLILMASAILSIVGLSLVQGDPRYSLTGWKAGVQDDPYAACNQEFSFDCAGYTSLSCVSVGDSGSPFEICPGRFCVDYCHVNDEDLPEDALTCTPCLEQAASEGSAFFEDCKTFELAKAEIGCQTPLNDYTSKTMTTIIILSVLCDVTAIVTIVITSWKSCSCSQ